MRSVILADIHSNLEALQAVFDDAQSRGSVDQVWCLGDIVGYGPNPSEVIDLLREFDLLVAVAGNHDWAVSGKIDTSLFNPSAAIAAEWSRRQLSADQIEYLNRLPNMVTTGDFTLVHGSPRDPIWEYLVTEQIAMASLEYFQTAYCLVGHSHLPFLCRFEESNLKCDIGEFKVGCPVALDQSRLIINPGGLGQPRDRDPDTNYAIYDDNQETICHFRLPYDICKTQRKMQQAGLPEKLVTRLSFGI